MKFLAHLFVSIILFYSFGFAGDSEAFHYQIGDLPLESGAILQNCQVAFREYGSPNADSSNVVVYPTWFGGQTAHIGRVIGAGKIVDTTKYFVIAVAALGNGESSSPSNSPLQPGTLFPKITIRDMVHAEYKMLQNRFGLKHVYAFIGGSMGSMQALEWMIEYPKFMDKVVAYVATPKLASADLLLMRVQESIIRMAEADTAQAWAALSALTRYAALSPDYVTAHTGATAVDSLWMQWQQAPHVPFSLQNYVTQLQAMQRHDIFKPFGDSLAETAKHVHAEVLFLLSESDHLLNPAPAQQFAPFISAKVIIIRGNGGHLAIGSHMKQVARAIEQFLK